MFKLGKRSLTKLENVNPALVHVVHRAINITEVDFSVLEGLRTSERQRQLVDEGKSQTMLSPHLHGRAVDLGAYVDRKISWDLQYYFEIAEAMRSAAQEVKVPLRWGAAWHCPDICKYPATMRRLAGDYIDLRKAEGRKPFVDAVHFELGV